MSRPNLLLAAAAAALTIGCAHCDTCDDFPAPCTGPNCGYPYQHGHGAIMPPPGVIMGDPGVYPPGMIMESTPGMPPSGPQVLPPGASGDEAPAPPAPGTGSPLGPMPGLDPAPGPIPGLNLPEGEAPDTGDSPPLLDPF